MELQSITAVSKALGMSARMLRYYEKIGLVESHRQPGNAYRMYDGAAVKRLRHILLLRRLRIPARQIGQIFSQADAVTALEVFGQNLAELEGELAALEAVRAVLEEMMRRLRASTGLPLRLDALCDEDLLALVPTPAPSNLLREETLMNDLNQTGGQMPLLRDVRIVYLPPATVAASHFVGPEPEGPAGEAIDRFVKEAGLERQYPALRMYGFNHPNPTDNSGVYGYEFWVTIPDDMAVPAPLEKKTFAGGLYAAHAIAMGNFQEWAQLDDWVKNSPQYTYNGSGTPENMFGALEEHLNYYSYATGAMARGAEMQLDLLIPVKPK